MESNVSVRKCGTHMVMIDIYLGRISVKMPSDASYVNSTVASTL